MGDITHVSQYVTAARTLLSTGDPITFLIEALRDNACWRVLQLKAACRCAQQDLDTWNDGCRPAEPCPDICSHKQGQKETGAHECLWCGASFRLRKHLGVHLARAHHIFSPARHLARGVTCVSCLKCYWTVGRHQQHLKTSGHCMLRTCLLVPCLSVDEMREGEGASAKAARQLRHGAWTSFSAALPAVLALGPRQLTSHERWTCSGRMLIWALCLASFRTPFCFPGSSFSWPVARRRGPEVVPRPSGTPGRSPFPPEFSLHWTRRSTALKSREEKKAPFLLSASYCNCTIYGP